MNINLQSDLAKYLDNYQVILEITEKVKPYLEAKRKLQKEQQLIEAHIISSITEIDAPAVQYKDHIFSVTDVNKVSRQVNIKKVKEFLLQTGVNEEQLETAFKLYTVPTLKKSKIILTKNDL